VGEIRLVPDWSTCRVLPWRPTHALVLADMCEPADCKPPPPLQTPTRPEEERDAKQDIKADATSAQKREGEGGAAVGGAWALCPRECLRRQVRALETAANTND
jgi:hypothetical protein